MALDRFNFLCYPHLFPISPGAVYSSSSPSTSCSIFFSHSPLSASLVDLIFLPSFSASSSSSSFFSLFFHFLLFLLSSLSSFCFHSRHPPPSVLRLLPLLRFFLIL